MTNFRAYRAIGQDNTNCYVIKDGLDYEVDSVSSIKDLVLALKEMMLQFGKGLTIDFTPLHNIEWEEYSNQAGPEKFRLCLPLTSAEIHQFWVHFTETE